MNNTIENSKFYKTFTPFISEKTQTADRTMTGIKTRAPAEKNKHEFNKSFIHFASAGGFLLVPIFVLLASREQLGKMKAALNKDYFLAINNKMQGGFLNGIAKHVRITKYYIIEGISLLTKPLQNAKDRFFRNVYEKSNNSFVARTIKNINTFFKNQKIFAFSKQDKKVKAILKNLEKSIDKHIASIDASANGKVKVLLPTLVRKNPADELPHAIDFSKTARGTSRSKEIKAVLSQIKSLLKDEKPNYRQVLRKITFSCEDIYHDANEVLLNIFLDLKKGKRKQYLTAKPIIRRIYDDLTKYRYGEIVKATGRDVSIGVRQTHLESLTRNVEELKKAIGDNPNFNGYLNDLTKILKDASNPNNMGLLERLRFLLKCKDIKTDFVRQGVSPSLFKHYQPEEYINTKKIINNLAKELKVAYNGERNLLPVEVDEIARGKIFTHGLSVAVPATVMLANCYDAKPKNKDTAKRTFFSFVAGSLVMTISHNIAVCSKIRAVLYGLITAYVTGKLYDSTRK